MNQKSIKIVNCLKVMGATAESPVTARTISRWIGREEINPSHRNTRKDILAAIKEGARIGSNTEGYYLLRSKKECQEYLNRLMAQMVKLSDRIGYVYKTMQVR